MGKTLLLELGIEEARVLRGTLETYMLSMRLSPGIWLPGMEEAAGTALGKLNELIKVAMGGRPEGHGEDAVSRRDS